MSRLQDLSEGKPAEQKKTEKATCKLCPGFDGSGYCKTKFKANQDDTPVCNLYGKLIEPKPDQDTPKTPQHIIDRANEILDKGDPIKHIFDTHQTLHIKDEIMTYARIVAIGDQSAINTKGIQPAADGNSGKGKSDGDKKFVHLLPPEYLLSGSVSDKVVYYLNTLKPGSVIHSDDVVLSEDLISTIKRATSNFQQRTKHHTLDKDRNPESNNIPERIVWLLNSVDNVNSLQLINRQFGVSVDETPEQDERVLNYQRKSGMFGVEELPITDDVLVCREIIRDIKKHLFRVVIPYNYLIEWTDISNRRNFDMFEDMIRGFAVFNYRQRIKEGDILFADLKDFDMAIKLYCKRTEQQGRKLTDSELRVVKAINKAQIIDVKTLQSATNLSRGRICQLINGKGKDSDSGLIHKVPGLGVEKITESTDNGTITKVYYTLEGFDEKKYENPIVWIEEEARKEIEAIYPQFTSFLLLKIKNSKEVVTLFTQFNTIHNNNKYNTLLELYLFGENGKSGKPGKYLEADNESEKVNRGKKGGKSL